jgi:predicted DNA-binding transcriptional regulator AlpA
MQTAAAPTIEPTNLLDFNLDGSMTLTIGQVCHLLDLSEPTFRRRLGQGLLKAFPAKLPGVGKWSKPAVVAWISSNGQVSAAQPRIRPDDAEIDAAVTQLEARYTGKGVAA